MNDARQIAAQALKALQLRRQLDRGDLTQEEYLDRLNTLQAGQVRSEEPAPPARRAVETVAARPPQAPAEPPPPKLAPALEALRPHRRRDEGEIGPREPVRLRQAEPAPVTPPAPKPVPAETAAPARPVETLRLHRRKDEGEMAPREREHFLQPELIPAAPPEPKPAPAESIAPAPRRRRPIEIVMSQPSPERFLSMKCPRCSAILRIYDRTAELKCDDCKADVVVRRANCTIALGLAGEAFEEANSILVPPIAAKTGEELQRLNAEAAKVMNVKRAAGILGGLCTAVFAYTGISDLASGHTGVGAIILFCGSVLIATVVCITLHTSREKAKLAERIRAITDDEEFA